MEHQPSEGFSKEMNAHQESFDESIYNVGSIEEFVKGYYDEAHLSALDQYCHFINEKDSILDVGVGYGATSAFLSQTNKVTAVEPFERFCTSLNELASRYKTDLKAICCMAENMSKMCPENSFDVALFQGSLHHCDDPSLALNETSKLLKPGGTIILVEPLIGSWVRKRIFYEKMRKNEIASGDYGGNEHVFYYAELKRYLIETGFDNIKISLTPFTTNLRLRLLFDLGKKIKGQFVISNRKVLLKIFHVIFIHYLAKIPFLSVVLMRQGIIPSLITATKLAQYHGL